MAGGNGGGVRADVAEVHARGQSVLVLSGLGPGEMWFGCEHGAWNTSRLERDCQRGLHGEPEAVPVAELLAMNEGVEVEAAKVERYAAPGGADVLRRPGIAVVVCGVAYLVDGHHRLRARARCRLPWMPVWLVVEESRYRVRFFLHPPGEEPEEMPAVEAMRLQAEGAGL